MTKDQKIRWLKSAAFLLETVGHLQGKEKDFLPHADALREIAKELKDEK